MKHNIPKMLIVTLIMSISYIFSFQDPENKPMEIAETCVCEAGPQLPAPTQLEIIAEPIPPPTETPPEMQEDDFLMSESEIQLIALLTMAEAEGECELGKRLVIDTVLNRVDSIYFPDTVTDVVYQKYQFEGMESYRLSQCYIKDELCDLVRDELKERTNNDVIFFRQKNYGPYGVPLFQIEHHYFSKYE